MYSLFFFIYGTKKAPAGDSGPYSVLQSTLCMVNSYNSAPVLSV